MKKNKKIKSNKQSQKQISVESLSDNQNLVNHLRTLAEDMISCRCQMGVDAEMEYCQEVVDDELGCQDEDVLDYEKKIDRAIDGITSTKRDDAISIHLDLIIGQIDKLFKISATPVPDLPKREEDIVVEEIEKLLKAQIFNNFEESVIGYMTDMTEAGVLTTEEEARQAVLGNGIDLVPKQDEIIEIAKKFKGRALSFMRKRAVSGAKKMERAIHDIVAETGFGDELIKFIHDYNTYPYAVMRTGSHLPFTRKVWKGNKWVWEDQELPIARRVAPKHFYWSSDSLEINDGLAVGDILYVKRSDLERLHYFEKNKTIKNNIQDCVTNCNSFKSWRNWVEYLGHDSENVHDDKSDWSATATVPIFRIHTLLDRCHLEEFGIKVEGDDLFEYECEAWLLNKKIVRIKFFDPKGYKRPYVIEKFRHLPGKFYGKSLAQILKAVEHKIRSTERSKLLNIGFSSAPTTLIDETAFNTDEDELPDVLDPGMNVRVRSYPGKTMKPIEYIIAPNITPQLRAELLDAYAEADLKSQIPRILTGQGQLSSSIRSASMLATQISGASKNLKRQIWLIASNVIKPYVEEVFNWYMIHGENENIKVDADVVIGSIESLVNREFLTQHIKELIQYLSPYAQNNQIDPKVIPELLNTLMVETGISEDTNNSDILEEFGGIVNDVSNNVGLEATNTGPQLDGRSNFAPIDTGRLK